MAALSAAAEMLGLAWESVEQKGTMKARLGYLCDEAGIATGWGNAGDGMAEQPR
jgi:hypothetical protein